jgi:ATP-dependent Clp protease adaptor protein ClpS
LHNDDVHDFLYVIACLIRFCNHDATQAEQCAITVHNRGKCSVKSGNFLEMLEIKNDLEDLELKTEIEEYEGHLY